MLDLPTYEAPAEEAPLIRRDARPRANVVAVGVLVVLALGLVSALVGPSSWGDRRAKSPLLAALPTPAPGVADAQVTASLGPGPTRTPMVPLTVVVAPTPAPPHTPRPVVRSPRPVVQPTETVAPATAAPSSGAVKGVSTAPTASAPMVLPPVAVLPQPGVLPTAPAQPSVLFISGIFAAACVGAMVLFVLQRKR